MLMEELRPDEIIASLRKVSLRHEPEKGKGTLETWVVEQLPMILSPDVAEPDYVGALEQLAIFISKNRETFHEAKGLIELRGRIEQLKIDDPTTAAVVKGLSRALNGVPAVQTVDYSKQLQGLQAELKTSPLQAWSMVKYDFRTAPAAVRQAAHAQVNRALVQDALKEKEWAPGFFSEASKLRQRLLEETGGKKLGKGELGRLRAVLNNPELGEVGPHTCEDRVLAAIIASRLGQETDLVDEQLSLLDNALRNSRDRFKRLANRLEQWGLEPEGPCCISRFRPAPRPSA